MKTGGRGEKKMIEIPFSEITVKEAVHLMKEQGGYIDGDREAVVLEEDKS